MEKNADSDILLALGASLNNGRYKIDRHLASGGFGNTYLAWDTARAGYVAIKEFYMSECCVRNQQTKEVAVPHPVNQKLFDQQRGKFRKEARRLWQFNNPHIIRVQDLFDENGTSYYVMDYIDGNSLSRKLKLQGRSFTEDEMMRILPQIMDALDVIHNVGIWHLDLKPANIMMDNQGNTLLIDFGASKQIRDKEGRSQATSSVLAYTQGYAPSEQMEQNMEKFGPWTDIYSLGATLYYLLTQHALPLPTDIAEDPVTALPMPSNLSPKMRKLILWMMNPNRTKRPQNIDEIRRFLGQSKAENKKEARQQEEEEVNATQLLAASKPDKCYNQGTQILDGKKKGNGVVKWLLCATLIVTAIWATFFISGGNHDNDGDVYGDSINLESTHEVKLKEKQDDKVEADASETFTVNDISFKMINVQGGTFVMGATEEQGDESEADNDEKPAHSVTVNNYLIGETEVTQELWETVMRSNPSHFVGAKHPVEQVSWNDCQDFIYKLNSITGQSFRLPTEAEWEYAARGGNMGQGYKYSGSNTLNAVAWYKNNGKETTHEVKKLNPNELGIYDMSGNVMEWCQDWFGNYSSDSQTNPKGMPNGTKRVIRGSSWKSVERGCRVSFRYYSPVTDTYTILGLRLAL